jgi:hypothetical protein
MRTWAVLGAAAALAAAAACVQAAVLPPEQRAGDVAFVSGGVSDDEATAFQAAMASYPLAIEILQNVDGHGQYTAGAVVRIARRNGDEVLNTRSDGPFMLARLAPGTYRVEAELNGRTQAKDVTVPAQGSAHVVLSFAGE